jgi:hypothetical protein
VSAARAVGSAASMIPNVSIVVAKSFMVSLPRDIPGVGPKGHDRTDFTSYSTSACSEGSWRRLKFIRAQSP